MNRIVFFSLVALMACVTAFAQSGMNKALVVVGTSATSGPDTFGWVALQPTDPRLLIGKQLALYRKNGNATSGNSYARIAIIEPVTDVRAIGALVARGVKLGENIADLNEVLTEMLAEASPAGTVTLEQKLSTLISSSWGHEDKMKRVFLLARQHPSVAMIAGIGHADKLPGAGMVTYEVRDFDTTSGTDLGVLGRVTVDPAAPLVLPAPGKPVELADTSAKGNLNVSLRWGIPNNLRDLSPMQYGYDLYRVTKVRALANGWNATPPASAAALAADPGSKRVNLLAILPPKLLTNVEAADPNNDTVFVNDDNGRFKTAGVPFPDAAEFYYFAVARDILGRGGMPSQGTLVQICDRLPPNAPRNVRVRNEAIYDGVKRDQRFLIEWDEPNLPAGETISAYYVYRWTTPQEIPAKSKHKHPTFGKPDRNLIAILPGTTHSFKDNGTTAVAWAIVDTLPPEAPTDDGKTYFYTIRAADGSVCQNLSGNSAPAWGVLRDRAGPKGASGSLLLRCFQPQLAFASATEVSKSGLPADQAHISLRCESTLAKGLAWAEFKFVLASTDHYLGRVLFKKGGTGSLEANLMRTIPGFNNNSVFFCRVSSVGGDVSGWVPASLNQLDNFTPSPDKLLALKWTATLNPLQVPGGSCGWKHQVVDPVTGTTSDISGAFTPTTGSREWKIYKRVNEGTQSLIAQGEIPAGSTAAVTWTDGEQVAANSTVCYFLQLFDEHGNPSPMTQQGDCIYNYDASFLPTPMLEPIVSVPPMISPKMLVKWFCNTSGVERFEVWVARASGGSVSSTGSGLSSDLATHSNNAGITGTEGLDFYVFQTSVAKHLTSGTPEFSFTLPVSFSDTYSVMIRAVGEGTYGSRVVGSFSNLETFQYNLNTIALPAQVPWPERPLPPQASFHSGISATYMNSGKLSPWKGNAVRIGEYADPLTNAASTVSRNDQVGGGVSGAAPIYHTSNFRDPDEFVYRNDDVAAAEPKETIPGCLMPIVMYRVQVTNANFSTVSGDIVQVSPLMERIANYESGGNTVVTDPFIAILHSSDSPLAPTETNFDHQIFLLDRQPVLKGARYKYLLVRLSPTKEIERVIATNTVDVPL